MLLPVIMYKPYLYPYKLQIQFQLINHYSYKLKPHHINHLKHINHPLLIMVLVLMMTFPIIKDIRPQEWNPNPSIIEPYGYG